MRLEGRVVLVTGASSGIGEATARLLVARGARVVLGARRADRLADLAAELGEDWVPARPTDVADESDVEALVALALTRFGRLDALFANAGLGGGGTLVDGDPTRWREMLLTNVYGLALTVRHAVQPMLAAGSGHVVLTSSVVARRPAHANYVYAATKHAVNALGEGLRRELSGRIRVTLIEPGMTDTAIWEDRPEGALDPEDVARVVCFCLEQPDNVSISMRCSCGRRVRRTDEPDGQRVGLVLDVVRLVAHVAVRLSRSC